MQKTGTRKSFMTLLVGVAIGGMTFGAVAVQAADKWEARPFFGAATGVSRPDAQNMGTVPTSSEGTLNATHVGRSTYTIEANQDYPRHSEGADHVMGNCAFVEDGRDETSAPGLVITAANGDQIFGHIDDDRSVVCAPDNQTGQPDLGDIYYTTLYVTVAGGTGRFADATGWLFTEGTSTLGADMEGPSTNDEGTFLGDIDY